MPQPLTIPAGISAPASQDIEDSLLHRVIAGSSASTPTGTAPRTANGIATGRFDSLADDGTPLVSIAAWDLYGIAARTLVPADPARIGETVALGFESGDPLRPIILGFMLEPAAIPAAPVPVPQEEEMPAMDALIDGERVVLYAEHEIELRCGDAALILSADGRIQLRGTYITSHASATQRILGGSVNVN
jgi:hypothetical protein